MKKQFIMVVSLLLVILISVSILAAPISINENFDKVTDGKVPADWKLLGDDKTAVTVVDLPIKPNSTPNCLKLVDDSPVTFAAMTRNIGDQPKGVLRYAVNMPATGGADFYSTLSKGGQSEGKVVDIALIASGNFKYRDQTGQTQTLQKIAKNVWHVVEVKWDVATGKFTLSLDGVKMGDFPLMKNMAPDTIIFKAGNNEMIGSVVYLDNVELITE